MDSPTVDGINTWMVSKLVASTGIKWFYQDWEAMNCFAGYPGFRRWKQILILNNFFLPFFVKKPVFGN
jgi:hypothetical protein